MVTRLSSRALAVITAAASIAAVASSVWALPIWWNTRTLNDAVAALEAGDAAAALVLARRASPSAHASLVEGSALLDLGHWAEAATVFTAAAARSGDPRIVGRALHDLALAELRLADESDAGGAGVAARASVAAGREALRLDPRREGSRWNLALAERLLEDSRPEGAPRPGDRGAVELSGAAQAPGGAVTGSMGMTPQAAAAILDALRSGEVESLTETLARTFASTRDTRGRGPPW